LKLKADFKVYAECAVAKARQKNLIKDWKGGSKVPGERVYQILAQLEMKVIAVLNSGFY
jgi:hypothetical protein